MFPLSRWTGPLSQAASVGSLVLFLVVSPGASAEVNWPTSMDLPHHDLSLGLLSGAAFGEGRGSASQGALFGVEAGWHHGVLGTQLGIRGQREGQATRLTGTLEVTAWYMVSLGAGIRLGSMLEPGGPGVPDREAALTLFVGAPIPLWASPDGAWILMPFVRPGVRLNDPEGISGHHELGLGVRWTSYGWSSSL